MLRWFERRLDPFPDAPPSQPPATLVAFCRHYTRGAERWLLLMAATTGPRTRRTSTHPRVGLVLGAGGTVGAAYHAGVLFSIEHHTGFDPRDATQIVGTSAGSLVGALLRAGVASDELVRLARRDDGPHLPEHLRDLHRASLVDVPSALELM